jgi:hypothetical protein
MRTLLALLIVFPICTLGLAQTKGTPCEQPIHYDAEGLRPQLGHKPVSVRSVAGKLMDMSKVPMPEICIGLFTDEDHKLVASTVTGEDGRFDFSDVPRGKYRLLARVHGYYVAEIRVQVVGRPGGGILRRERITIGMQLPGVH